MKKQLEKVKSILEGSNIKIEDFYNIESLVDEYKSFTDNIEHRKINLCFPTLNKMIRGLRTQELLTIIAPTGIGKSAIALNMLMNFVKEVGGLAVMFSLEMSTIGIAERVFQIELDVFGYEVENKFIGKDEQFIKQCYNVQKSYNNLIVVVKRIDVNMIGKYINVIETLKERKVNLICIDYVGILNNAEFQKDEYMRITDNMLKLQKFAKELDCAIINISQISRQDLRNKVVDIFSGKGSGEIENSSDFLISMEIIDENNPKDIESMQILEQINKSKYLSLAKLEIKKKRRGENGCVYVIFNRKNLRIYEPYWNKSHPEEAITLPF